MNNVHYVSMQYVVVEILRVHYVLVEMLRVSMSIMFLLRCCVYQCPLSSYICQASFSENCVLVVMLRLPAAIVFL